MQRFDKWARLIVLIGVIGISAPTTGSAQVTRTEAVPHYISGLKQIEPDAAAVYCAAVSIDAGEARRADVIDRLAAAAFGEDMDVLALPLKNAAGFVAPRSGAGKRSQAATFEVTYSGFSPEARSAFQYAVDIWSALIESSVPIRIEASWTSLDPRILGSAGPEILHGNFDGSVPDTWYASSLADALTSDDLSPDRVDVVANFNSDFGAWYFGLDGNTPPGEIDFVTVVLHEIGHGLSFFGTMDVDDGAGNEECGGIDGTACWGFQSHPDIPDIFERFAEDLSGNLLIDTGVYPNPSVELGDVLTGERVFFDGPAAVSAFGGRPPLYAPPDWNSGSSFSHLDETSFPAGDPSALMTPSVAGAEAIHDPGEVGCGIFADMGWTTTAACGANLAPPTPSIPVPLSPANDAIDVPVDVTFSWAESIQADAYTLEIARTESFASPDVSVSGITETSYEVNGLETETQYFWHVRATNAQSVSDYSTAYRFVTTAAPPPAPELLAPEDGAGSLPTTVTLEWDGAENVGEYIVEVDTTAEFAAPVNRIATLDTELVLAGLKNEQTYFWRVRGLTGGGAGDWSSTWAFTTIVALPAPPQLVSPEEGATSVSIDVALTWNSAARSDRYEVVIASDSTFRSIVADSVLTDTTYTAQQLQNHAQHYWRVRGRNDAGAGAWSAIYDFRTIIAAPAVPRLLTPENGARDIAATVTFTWEEAVDAAAYEFELSTSLNFDDPVLEIPEIDSTALTVADLDFSRQYFWRVRAINSGGRSVFTTPFSFITRVAPPGDDPAPASPFDGATGLGTDVNLEWNSVTGADAYRVQVGTDPELIEGLVADSAVSGTSIVLDGLDFETTYYWRVAAVNDGGQGPWSAAFGFTTQFAPPGAGPMLVSPPDSATGQDRSIQIGWEPVESATSYQVVVARDSAFAETVVTRTGLEATSFIVSNLEYETTYWWRVRARNAGGFGPWSERRQFTTVVAPSGVKMEDVDVPASYSLDQNYPNPFNPATTFSFALPAAAHVLLEVMDVAGRTVAVVVDQRMPAGRHEVTWAATGLPSGTYVYRIRAGKFMRSRTFVLLK